MRYAISYRVNKVASLETILGKSCEMIELLPIKASLAKKSRVMRTGCVAVVLDSLLNRREYLADGQGFKNMNYTLNAKALSYLHCLSWSASRGSSTLQACR